MRESSTRCRALTEPSRLNNLGSSRSLEADPTMQILHPFAGSVAEYIAQLDNPDQYRPHQCPLCQAKHPLAAHGFYTRTIIDSAFDGWIRVRRYLCESCRRTVSLLPDFALPHLRFSVTVIAAFLVARLVHGKTLRGALRRQRPISAGSRGSAAFAPTPNLLRSRCPRSPIRRLRRTSLLVHWPCSMRQIGFPRIGSCSPAFGNICWAGRVRSFPTAAASRSRTPRRPPERLHTSFVWN